MPYTIITMSASPTSAETTIAPPVDNEAKAAKNPRIKHLAGKIRNKISRGDRPLEALRDASVDSPEAEAAKFIIEEPIPFREYATTPEDRIKGEIARIQSVADTSKDPSGNTILTGDALRKAQEQYQKEKTIGFKRKDQEKEPDLPPEIQEAVQKAFDSGTPKTSKPTAEEKIVKEKDNAAHIKAESERIKNLMLQAQRKTNYLEKQKIATLGAKLNMGHKPLTYENTLSKEQMDKDIHAASQNATSPEDKMAKLFTKHEPTPTTLNETPAPTETQEVKQISPWDKFLEDMRQEQEFYENPPEGRLGDEKYYEFITRTNFDTVENKYDGESWEDYARRGGPAELEKKRLDEALASEVFTDDEDDTPPADLAVDEPDEIPDQDKSRLRKAALLKNKITARFGKKDKAETTTTSKDGIKPAEAGTSPVSGDEYIIDFTGSKSAEPKVSTPPAQDKADDQSSKGKGFRERLLGRFSRDKKAEPADTTTSENALQKLTDEELTEMTYKIYDSQDKRYSSDSEALLKKVSRIIRNKRDGKIVALAEAIKASEDVSPELEKQAREFMPFHTDPIQDILKSARNISNPDNTQGKPDIATEGSRAEIQAEIQKLSKDKKNPSSQTEITRLNNVLTRRNEATAIRLLNQRARGIDLPMAEILQELTGSVPDNLTPEIFDQTLQKIAENNPLYPPRSLT